jgi:endoglucanase
MLARLSALATALTVLSPAVAKAADSDVKVSSIGYLPAHAKRASITAPATSFSVKRDSDGQAVFNGTVSAAKTDPDTQQSIAVADFTAMTETGTFYVDVPGVGRSVTFPVGNDVYKEPFIGTMLGFYGWRCNTAVSFTWQGQTYAHDACHMDDAHLDYVGTVGGQRDGRKGWHDAGDYGKYTVNAGITLGSLLAAWEEYATALASYAWPIPETGGATPDFLDEARFEIEWVSKMQYGASDGRVSHKLTSLTFDAPSTDATGTDAWVMPEKDLQTRYFVPWGSAATADFVAMLAKAARIYKPYDAAFADQCLAAAKVSYAYLVANTANQSVNDPTSTGAYGTSDTDDRLWAAAEMWETTGDAAALADFETRAAKYATGTSTYVDADFDWGNVKNLGMFIYLQSKRSGRSESLVSAIQKSLLSSADTLVTNHNNSGYGRALSGKTSQYYWGSNGSVARTCMLLQVANRLAPKADYLDTCVDQIGWLFGRNYYNRSQVTGLGLDPPMHPHHRPSVADGIEKPWPGLLVGGGNNGSKQAKSTNGAVNWLDEVDAYELNEVAINWNAPLVYALASFLPVDRGPVSTVDAATGSDAEADAQTTPDALSMRDASPDEVQSRDARGEPDSSSPTRPDAGADAASTLADAAVAKDTLGNPDTRAADAPASGKSGCACAVGASRPGLGFVWMLMAAAIIAIHRRRSRR